MEAIALCDDFGLSQRELLATPVNKFYEMLSGLKKLNKARKEAHEKQKRKMGRR